MAKVLLYVQMIVCGMVIYFAFDSGFWFFLIIAIINAVFGAFNFVKIQELERTQRKIINKILEKANTTKEEDVIDYEQRIKEIITGKYPMQDGWKDMREEIKEN
jgi:ABC-type transport system involved in Fe-S cluster assembly fused permease/ATPase subunit